jgi:signal transduction histidine kinase
MATRRLKLSRALRPIHYKIYLFLAMVLLTVALVVHSNYIIGRLNAESRSLCTVLARFFAVSTIQAAEDPMVRPIFQEVARNINFPLVLTDLKGIPRAWKGIGIQTESVSDSLLQIAESTGVSAPPVKRIQQIARQLDRVNRPIPVVRLGLPDTIGQIHYGEPPVVGQLRWLPYLEFAGIVLLLVLGFAGFRSLMAGEQRLLWAALAKETAHQLGTPLSSLMGWTAHLRAAPPVGERPRASVDEIASEMDRDLDRLNKVASRFAQLGSVPVLREGDLTASVAAAVSYFRSRLPHLGSSVSIEERYDPIPPVAFHPQLIEWVVENLIKNAIDAADKPAGRIEVSLAWAAPERAVRLRVADNGRGMTATERRRAFDAGFSTKRRGWGLGLALVRRVVREYHRGSVSIVETVPGKGTTVLVSLPAPSAPPTGRPDPGRETR